jgi:hypothetical protein
MEVEKFVSESGGLTSVMHDDQFSLKEPNHNYLWMDTASLLFDK